MNDIKEFELLSDLARLIKKYGPETFEKLAHNLNNTNFVERLTEILKTTAKIGRDTRITAKKPSDNFQRQDFHAFLAKYALQEPEKGILLMNLYEALKSKVILPTLKDMQNFTFDNRLPSLNASSREKAIIPLVKSFFPMPVQDVKECIKRIQSNASKDRGLEGWSDIIFGKK